MDFKVNKELRHINKTTAGKTYLLKKSKTYFRDRD